MCEEGLQGTYFTYMDQLICEKCYRLDSLCNIQKTIQNFEKENNFLFSSLGVEETLYLLLLVAKKNRKSVDIQNSKGKVKTEERKDNISK